MSFEARPHFADAVGQAAAVAAQPKPEAKAGDRGWRWVALIGAAASIAGAASRSFPLEPRQGRLVVSGLIIAVLTLLALRFVFPWPWQRVRVQRDLLVPIGVLAGAEQLLGLLALAPLASAVLAPSWSAQVLGLSLSVSLEAVLNIGLWTAFAAWQTDLVRRGLTGEQPLRLSPGEPVRRHFLRALVVLVIGVGVLLVGMTLVLATVAVVLPLAIAMIALLAIAWNLATAALLPVVLIDRAGLNEALGQGFRISWQLKGRWWRALMVQLLLLGIFVGLRVHYAGTGGGQGQFRTETKSTWNVNAFWVGGYENGCRWQSKYAQLLEVPAVPLITQGLALLFLVLALAMKITVIGELLGTTLPPPLEQWAGEPPPPAGTG